MGDTGRQTDKTDRQAVNRQIDKQPGSKQADRQTGRQTDSKHADRQTDRQTGSKAVNRQTGSGSSLVIPCVSWTFVVIESVRVLSGASIKTC